MENDTSPKINSRLLEQVEAYISENYVQRDFMRFDVSASVSPRQESFSPREKAWDEDDWDLYDIDDTAPSIKRDTSDLAGFDVLPEIDSPATSAAKERLCGSFLIEPSLEDRLNTLDESFSQMLLRLIKESSMSESECYKRANVDRKLFSKIRNDPNYRPSKITAISFAIALRLPLKDALDLLGKAGFTLSHSSKFDVIIEFFISSGNYDIFEINDVLFTYDQPLLGLRY